MNNTMFSILDIKFARDFGKWFTKQGFLRDNGNQFPRF